MDKPHKSFKDLVFEINGSMGAIDDAYANAQVPEANPYKISLGAPAPEQSQSSSVKQPTEEEKRRHKHWKNFIKSYREEYLNRLRNGFQTMIAMLNELAQEKDQGQPPPAQFDEDYD